MKVAIAELLPRIHFDTTRNKNATMLEWLAKSIGEIGLQHPIGVYHDADGVLQVVAGRHRVLACAKLGMVEIEAVVLDDLSPLDRELWTIDENLRRADLDSFERDKQTKLRVELVKKQLNHGLTAQGNVPPPLTSTERSRRTKARRRGEDVPPTPRKSAAIPPGPPQDARRIVADQLGVQPSTVTRRIQKTDPEKRAAMGHADWISSCASRIHHVLTTRAADWPEVKRRVEEKLGKRIVDRIDELERGPAEVVEFTAAG